jgi:hypothetical protein
MLDKMLETSESVGMEHAERHPVGGVVLTKITPEEFVCHNQTLRQACLAFLSQTARFFVFFEIGPNRTFLKNLDPY